MEEVYLDTSMILEPYSVALKSNKRENTWVKYCKWLMNYGIDKNKIKPCISCLVLGEIYKRILNCEPSEKLDNAKEEINSFIKKCEILSINPIALEIAERIAKNNPRIKNHYDDILHFGIAMSHKKSFFSIELSILDMRDIQLESKKLGLKIIDKDFLLENTDNKRI